MKPRNPCTGRTMVYGIFGWPVEHTLSPFMLQAAFNHLHIDAVYVPFAVAPGSIRNAVAAVRALGLHGVNVTIPHKKAVIPYLDELRGIAVKVGAVNTVVHRKGRLIGYNTDVEGFLASLQSDAGFSCRGHRGVLLGAGGAGEAVAIALAGAGIVSLTIADVLQDRATRLARKIHRYYPKAHGRAVPLQSGLWTRAIRETDLLVNATPIGMVPGEMPPVDPAMLHPRQTVYDLIYHHETRLVQLARRKGCHAFGGLGMLLHQGMLALEIWTGRQAPMKLMARALREALIQR